MKNNILLVTDYNDLYRQDIYRSQGIDLNTFKGVLTDGGYHVTQITYNELLNHSSDKKWSDYYVVYTSSENIEYKEYIKDVIYELGKRNTLIPRYDLLMCHEDKLYQEILKKSLEIKSLKASMYATLKDLYKDIDNVTYPVVVKKCVGAGSISVYKANNKKELLKYAKKIMRSKECYEYYLKAAYKKVKGSLNAHYFEDEKYFGRMILQEYVPDLACDWKVLAFGDKYYALRRSVRKNDFRASGSGMFAFEIPDSRILDYAKEIYEKVDVPFLSMDLCLDELGNVYLIEFQGVHFGPYTLINSPHYFVNENGWQKIEKNSKLAEEYANSIIKYIDKITRTQN